MFSCPTVQKIIFNKVILCETDSSILCVYDIRFIITID